MLFSTVFMAAVANAHLFIQSPPPIPGSAIKDPLFADGSNFPCHGVAFPGSGGMAMPAGSQQLLAFDSGNGANTAVHGGGSCQISVTYETDKTKIRDPKNWYVIHSIEGGCPTNSPANLGGTWTGPSGSYTGSQQCNDSTTNGFDCVNQFDFELPKGMKNGQATLAWTWFNTIGNREMYMNCVAIDITGGASDDKGMQDLPGLFVANLVAPDLPSSCRTTERTNIAFPQPGPVLEYKKPSPRMPVASASSQYPIGTPSSCPDLARNAAAQPSVISAGGAGAGPASYPAGGTNAGSGSSPGISSAAAYEPAASVPSSGGPPAAGSAQSFVTSVAASPSTAYNNAGGTAAPTGAPTTGSGKCAAGSVPCSVPGALVCPDSQHYGLCDINNCAVVGSVSAGTQCKDGVIAFLDPHKRDVVRKRLARFAPHYHHRRS